MTWGARLLKACSPPGTGEFPGERWHLKPMKIRTCGALPFLTAMLYASGIVYTVSAGDSGAYLRLDGGFTFADNLSLDVGGTPGTLRLKDGYRADLDLGYDLNRWVAFQIEGGFFHSSAESLVLNNFAAHLGNTWHEGLPIMGEVIFRWANSTDFTPYVGGGAGGIVSTLSINRDSDSTFVFAYQATAGVIYKLDERAWIDLFYKFLNSDDSDYEIGGIPIKSSRVRQHLIGAGVTWLF